MYIVSSEVGQPAMSVLLAEAGVVEDADGFDNVDKDVADEMSEIDAVWEEASLAELL
jgi:translation elongation factor EF-Tu-like GTPase